MSQVSLDTDDPQLYGRVAAVLERVTGRPYSDGDVEAVLAALAASLEPSEPPPGVYQAVDGHVFLGLPGGWLVVSEHGSSELMRWAEARDYVSGALTPLRSVDELIPDPDDPKAVREFRSAVTGQLRSDGTPGIYLSGVRAAAVDAALRVLRARAEARGPQNDGGNS